MREYKFRGKNTITGDLVYGYFMKNWEEKCFILDEYEWPILVDPDTVVPLVGHDISGEEVYEGDWLWDEDNEFYFQVKWDEDEGGFTLSGYLCGYDEYFSKIREFQLTAPPEGYEEGE